MSSNQTVRLTTAQALVKYLSAQYSLVDGERQRFIPAMLGIFGHGNVAGLGQALDQHADELPFVQGRNEQSLVHMATAFAKARRRTATLAVTASVGPGALNMTTAAALATVNRLPVLLLPGDIYATRRQGPVLQQLEHPSQGDVSVNDAFRPLSAFFDRISRPEQLLTALPEAMRILTSPTETGAVVISLPQDVQSHAHDFPVEFFEEQTWRIRRTLPDPEEVAEVAKLIRAAQRPVIIAGGGVIYSGASDELEALAERTGIPVTETFAGKGAVQHAADWFIEAVGLEGNPQTNELVATADLVISVGTRLTDFVTASQSIFANPGVRFASINVSGHDARKQGATQILADARLGLVALAEALGSHRVPTEWSARVSGKHQEWQEQRAAALDPDHLVDKHDRPGIPDTDAILSQGQLIGLLGEHARSGDVIISAAGSPPGDLQKVWDATEGRGCHLEFGFSCMGYEVPAAIGVRLADSDHSHRITALVGDGTFVMAPSELLTAAQEGLPVTIVISENHGYQVIRRLQMARHGRSFGNEFRYRTDGPTVVESAGSGSAPALAGEYLTIGLESIASGLGALTIRATTADEVRAALADTRDHAGPVVLVVPTIPHYDLPGAGVWWDVAPAEVSEQDSVTPLREEYEAGLLTQRWHG